MLKIRSITLKLILLLILAAVLPLSVFGMVSVIQAGKTAREAVLVGNLRVATRAAEQIGQYVDNSIAILRSTAENVSRADLKPWQRERVIRNMTLEFDEFSEILLVDRKGEPEAVSGVGDVRMRSSPFFEGALAAALAGKTFLSPVFITDELTPALIIAMPVQNLGEVSGAVAAEVDLLQMWRLVDRIRIGEKGYLNVVAPGGRLIASGDGEMKRLVFQEKEYPDKEALTKLNTDEAKVVPFVSQRASKGVLIAATALPEPLSWIVVMEQPTSEAFALSRRLSLILTVLVAAFIVAMCLIGFFGAHWQIVNPIRKLISGTRRIAKGELDCRVRISSQDELGELASSFNSMAGALAQMQENIRNQERMAFFGRIASGLAHDLKHPVKSIENVSRLMEDMHNDPEYRETFRRVVAREFSKINQFLDNLRTISHDIPYHPVDLSLGRILDEVVDTFAMEAESHGIRITKAYHGEERRIYADMFSITRAFSNLLSNAIQAIEGSGEVTIGISPDDKDERAVVISVRDTGCGIPPERIETVFSDFVTTKRKGLGLGLALVKRIFDQHDARIWVESDVGQGTSFHVSIKTRAT
jgi:signal transduction histidine kinase